MPLALAFIAGGIATANPCGFALLPPLLAMFLGDDERSVPNRILGAVAVGATLTLGFMAVFLAIGMPVALGATRITGVIPWFGAIVGVLLFALGVAAISGRHLGIRLPIASRRPVSRGLQGTFLYGAAYGGASLGCTLPVFLAVVGASLANTGVPGVLLTFASWGLGMGLVFTALAVSAAVARDGVEKLIRRLLPKMDRIAAVLLLLAGGYLTYYWSRVLIVPAADLADDPLVSAVQGFVEASARLAATGGEVLVVAAAAVAAIGVAYALYRRAESRGLPSPESEPSAATIEHDAQR